MSDDIVGIEFRASANFRDVEAQAARATAALDAMRKSVTALGSQAVLKDIDTFTSNLGNSSAFTVRRAEIETAEKRWGKLLQDNKLKLTDYTRAVREHYSSRAKGQSMINKLAKQQVEIERSLLVNRGRASSGNMSVDIIRPNGLDVNDLANKTSIARKEMQILNTVISQGSTKLIDWGKNTQWAGRQIMVGLSIPIGIFGAAAGKAFYELDKGLTRVTKVYGDLGTQLSQGDIQKLRQDVSDLAKTLAQDYGSAMDQTIGLAADFAAVGQQGNDLINSTTEATRLSILGEVDRQDAMKTTLALTSAFRVEQKDLADTINFLNAVENQTSLSLQDLSIAIPKVGPVVRNLGGSVKDLALYLTAMKEGGVNAGEGANAIKSGLVSIINPTKKATEFLEKFGVDLPKIVRDNAGDITGTIRELALALDDLDPLNRQRALANLFQKYQVARMTALFDNINRDGAQAAKVLDLMAASTSDLAGIASRELSQVTESASGKWNRAVESFKVALAGVGEEFLKIGTAAVNVGTKLLEFFGGQPDWVKNLVIFGGIFAALSGGVIMITGVFANFLGTMFKLIQRGILLKDVFRGQASFIEILTEETWAAKMVGDKMSESMYKQAEATALVTKEVQNLIVALQSLERKERAAMVASVESVGMHERAIAEMNARGYGRPGFRTEIGHITAGNALRDTGLISQSNQGFRYGVAYAMESAASNQGPGKDKSATLFGAPGFKQFDMDNAIRNSASNMAMVMMTQQKEISTKMARRWRAETQKATERMLAARSPEEAKQVAESLRTWMAGQKIGGGGSLLSIFEERFTAFDTQFRASAAKIAQMDDAEVMNRLRAALRQFDGVTDEIIENVTRSVQQGTIDARTMLLQTETSIASQLAVNPGGRLKMETTHTGRDKTQMQGYYYPIAGALYADMRTVDEAAQDAVDKQRAAADQRNKTADADMATAIAAERSSRTRRQRIMGALSGNKAMAGLGALSMASMFMPAAESQNTSVNNAINIAQGAGMGASIGSFIPGIGTALGAGIGAAIPAITALVDKLGEVKRANEAAFTVGTDAVARYGASIKNLADIIDTVPGQSPLGPVQEIANAMMAQDENSPDRQLIEFIRGEEDKAAILAKLRDRAVNMAVAGVKGQDINNQIAALLNAGGKSALQFDILDSIDIKTTDNHTAKIKNIVSTLQSEINDAMAATAREDNGWNDMMTSAFGDKYEEVFAALKNKIYGDGSAPGIQDIMGGPLTTEQAAALDQLRLRMQEIGPAVESASLSAESFNENMRPVVELLLNSAATLDAVSFNQVASQLDLAGMSASDFAQGAREIYASNPQAVSAINALSASGADATQMLQAMSLRANGVITSWNQLATMAANPLVFKVIYETWQVTKGAVNQAGTSFVDQLNAKAAKADKAAAGGGGSGGGGGGNSGNSARRDALNKRKKDIQDYYDKEIEKVKEADDAKKKAAEAEQRRLARQKRDLQNLIAFREALAAGDFAAAAKAKLQIDTDRKNDKIEDRRRNEEDASQARIKQLEDERDKKLAAIDKVLDAIKDSNGASVASTASATSKIANNYRDLATQIQTILNGNVTDFDGTMKKIISLAKSGGLDVKDTIEKMMTDLNKTLPEGFQTVGTDIWNVIKGDLQNAPWSMVDQIIKAAMAGDQALLKKKLMNLNLYVANKGTSDKAAAIGNVNKASDPRNTRDYPARATGGHIVGPGTATSDSILSWLSNGEYVIRASMVNRYGKGFFDMLNSGRLPAYAAGGAVKAIGNMASMKSMAYGLYGYANGGMVQPRFRQGGMAGYSMGGFATGGMGGNMYFEVNVTEPNCTAEEIAEEVAKVFYRKQKKVGFKR